MWKNCFEQLLARCFPSVSMSESGLQKLNEPRRGFSRLCLVDLTHQQQRRLKWQKAADARAYAVHSLTIGPSLIPFRCCQGKGTLHPNNTHTHPIAHTPSSGILSIPTGMYRFHSSLLRTVNVSLLLNGWICSAQLITKLKVKKMLPLFLSFKKQFKMNIKIQLLHGLHWGLLLLIVHFLDFTSK